MLKPTISKLPELVIFGGPLPKSWFYVISATVFHANLITGNIWPRVDEPLRCLACPFAKKQHFPTSHLWWWYLTSNLNSYHTLCRQRCKNVQECMQCLCIFYPCLGKSCATFNAVFLQNGIMLRLCAFKDLYGF